MKDPHISKIAAELESNDVQVQAAAQLLDQGMTIPFIARYRKEATGGLDEVILTAIRDRLAHLRELDKRRDAIIKSLEKSGQLTQDLSDKILAAETLAILEDIYLPFRPKRRTRASVALGRGLEPLAKNIFEQGAADPMAEAVSFVDPEKGVESIEDALAGARDIIAEWINEDTKARSQLRDLFETKGELGSKVSRSKKEVGNKFQDYFDWSESLSKAPSHRVLAMMRGENEGILKLHVAPSEEEALSILESHFVHGEGLASQQVSKAAWDSYKRLLAPSMERECLSAIKAKADEKAIAIFAENLRQLLLAPPLGQKTVLAIDPGFRTGCKMVILDPQGGLVNRDTIYPHEPHNNTSKAAEMILAICENFGIEVIAVGNGTAGRETEAFLKGLKLRRQIPIMMVDESGASIYSASETARQEFPDQDVTVRGAVSIGRRLMDPLAELVKIDPKSIGVGQYQHDVDQSALKKKLGDEVISCVNMVGVDLNTASKEVLAYVSGLGPKLAESIVQFRKENGPFRSRKVLKKVPRLGPKAFEQAAGFLRIRDGDSSLDSSAIHPESYAVVDVMAKDLGVSVKELMENVDLQRMIDPQKYVCDEIGMPTLCDILLELKKPGRDPRQQIEAFSFAEEIKDIEDLEQGMKLPGIVSNVTAFGAFVDIGVHQDGLVHISQLADKFVRNPADIVKVRQKVMVTVLDVDLERKRISLSMKNLGENQSV